MRSVTKVSWLIFKKIYSLATLIENLPIDIDLEHMRKCSVSIWLKEFTFGWVITSYYENAWFSVSRKWNMIISSVFKRLNCLNGFFTYTRIYIYIYMYVYMYEINKDFSVSLHSYSPNLSHCNYSIENQSQPLWSSLRVWRTKWR